MSTYPRLFGFGKLLFVAILCLGLGAGGLWYYDNKIKNVSPQPVANAASPLAAALYEPIFLEIAPFTVTLRNDLEDRVLYAGITLRLTDEGSRQRLIRYMPIVRSEMLSELNQINPARLHDPLEREQTQARIKQTLSAPISPDTHPQHIEDVLFTAFVVQ